MTSGDEPIVDRIWRPLGTVHRLIPSHVYFDKKADHGTGVLDLLSWRELQTRILRCPRNTEAASWCL